MAKTQVVVVAGVSASRWIPLDTNSNPFNVGFGVQKVGSGDITYSVQHTFHEILAETSIQAFDHSQVSGRTSSIDGNYAFAVNAVRLNVTATSGNASAILRLIQSGR
jgi:hypothetical protein